MPPSSGCHDVSYGAQCCARIGQIPLVKEHADTLCVRFDWVANKTKIETYLSWNTKVLIDLEIIDFKEDTCVILPIPKIGGINLCITFPCFTYNEVYKTSFYQNCPESYIIVNFHWSELK